MDVKRAIEILSDKGVPEGFGVVDFDYECEEYEEACDIAIEALKTKCNKDRLLELSAAISCGMCPASDFCKDKKCADALCEWLHQEEE